MSNKYLEKISASKEKASKPASPLQPHQGESLKKLDSSNGILLHHSTGSGKTKTFLMAAKRSLDEHPDNRALIVAPASLVRNVDKEILKHKLKIDRSRMDVYSYEKATNMADQLSKNKYSIAIADEAQKLRNSDTKRVTRLSEIISKADKRVLATATANYNHPADIAPIMNMVSGQKLLPEDRKAFEKAFLTKRTLPRTFVERLTGVEPTVVDELKNKQALRQLFKKHVHYYDSKEDPDAAKNFPKVHEKTVEVEMSPEQRRTYSFVEGKMPFILRHKIRMNLPLDKQELAQMNSFATGVRQVSNSHRVYSSDKDSLDHSPKIHKAVESLSAGMAKNKNFRGLVYSNFLDAGVHEYADLLKKKGIKHGVYTGALSAAEKAALVDDYNTGKTPVLLISSSGAEGLDLKGTRMVQVMEPHFNKSKIVQVTGRAARYKSHEHLPEEERNVEVEHYLSVHPKPLLGSAPHSIDKYLYANAKTKATVFDQIKAEMRDAS